MELHHVRRGAGAPLVLVHGIGGTWRSWSPVLDALAAEREVVAVDLPGFGETPAAHDGGSIASLADALTGFLEAQGLRDAALVGSSMGARLVMELARRGVGGDVVALDPGGFWTPGQKRVFGGTLKASIRLVRLLQPVAPALSATPVTRAALLAQLSRRPWALPRELVLQELRSLADGPAFDAVLDQLLHGPAQEGAPAGSLPGRMTIGWGRNDLVTLPSQAARAQELFPDATVHWFERCGHFPHWDQPRETVEVVLAATA
ncbi:alpha/beta fold hydrolase [Paraconexibacter algicola]|uniref:Alpha/beta hydrolase n=1 Tax=Paraconexibacter algicola TaxID=2133960 RepID=A0A2T4UM93_9ACTN|nr:alpha/beta fold hydrolase [Paraconexibacter algicola]PTL60366.1 alpha/beta hydrolase [Paraconexibacter algicola]